MEYMTVLKRPEHDFVEKGVNFEIKQNSWKARLASRRLCSQALFVVVILFLMFVLFASQLIVHVQMKELRRQTQENNDKMNDILEASLLQKEQMDKHLATLEQKLRDYRRRRRNHQDRVYAILRGGNERNYSNGIFKWSTAEDNNAIWISPNLHDSITNEMIQVPYNGLYSIDVGIKVEGRDRAREAVIKSVGMWICKQVTLSDGSTRDSVIEKVFLTQDGGGAIGLVRGGLAENPPIDILAYSNIVYLRANDRIFVRVPEDTMNDDTIRYNNKREDSHFSIYLLLRD